MDTLQLFKTTRESAGLAILHAKHATSQILRLVDHVLSLTTSIKENV